MRDHVFISYSHADGKWLNMLLEQLKPLANKGLDVWSDRDISPGQEWPVEVDNYLNRAKVAVLLVSANFLNSDFIRVQELPRLLEAAQLEQVTILPVLISACLWDETDIGKYQSPINPKPPLKALLGHKRDQAFVKIARAIKDAWEKPIWSLSLPEDRESKGALEAFRLLADQHAAMTADSVDACFRRAVLESYPHDSRLQDVFSQLNTAQSLGWPQLTAFFDESNRPAATLVQALESQLNADTFQAQTSLDAVSYIALVLERHRSWTQNSRYYTWSAFISDEESNTYRKLNNLEGLDLYRNQVVFDKPLENETAIATILAELLSWAKHNTTLPVLEIFAPTELLDAPWAELVVEQRDSLTITLLQSIPFVLRPGDRLLGFCNSNRPRLLQKYQKLTDGHAKWCSGNLAADPYHLLVTLVEEDQAAGIKRLKPFPLDQTKRHSWFEGLVESMVPVAIWYHHGAKVSAAKGIAHLQRYEMLSGHQHGDPICSSCVRYDEVARQRKKFFNDAVAKHLVLMLDHWQRIPPITPQARGATRAIAPSPL
jgi:hypothetical protein